MVCKESDGKHFDPHTGNPEPIFCPANGWITLIMKMAYAISATQWKIVAIGKCFGTVGRNGRTVSSPNFILNQCKLKYPAISIYNPLTS